MSDHAVAAEIIRALADYLKRDPASIKEAHHLRDDLGLDSMAVIELLYKIEETFNMQIPDQDLPAMSTVGSVATYVQQRLTAAKPASPQAPRKSAPSRITKKPVPARATKKLAPPRTPKQPAPSSKKKKR